jgi:hypothetical protein
MDLSISFSMCLIPGEVMFFRLRLICKSLAQGEPTKVPLHLGGKVPLADSSAKPTASDALPWSLTAASRAMDELSPDRPPSTDEGEDVEDQPDDRSAGASEGRGLSAAGSVGSEGSPGEEMEEAERRSNPPLRSFGSVKRLFSWKSSKSEPPPPEPAKDTAAAGAAAATARPAAAAAKPDPSAAATRDSAKPKAASSSRSLFGKK